MIGLDTNVLVRYAVRDDARQTRLADQLFAALDTESPGFLSHTVLVETWWVLRRAYAFPPDQCREFFGILLDAREFIIEEPDLARAALQRTVDGADFADALVSEAAKAAGSSTTMTFDRQAAKHAGMTLLTTAALRDITAAG